MLKKHCAELDSRSSLPLACEFIFLVFNFYSWGELPFLESRPALISQPNRILNPIKICFEASRWCATSPTKGQMRTLIRKKKEKERGVS